MKQEYATKHIEQDRFPENAEKKDLLLKQKIGRTVCALTIVFGIGGGLGLNHAITKETFTNTTHEYTIKPGDTLFNISNEIEGVDKLPNKQDAVHEIETRSNIDSAGNLKPGQKIEIPNGVSVGIFDQTAQNIDKTIQNDNNTARQSIEES